MASGRNIKNGSKGGVTAWPVDGPAGREIWTARVPGVCWFEVLDHGCCCGERVVFKLGKVTFCRCVDKK